MGLIKIGLGALAAGALLYGTYKLGRYEFERLPYQIKEDNGAYSLLDKRNGRSEPIGDDLQVGSIDHRVAGVLDESRTNFNGVENAVVRLFHKYYQPR